MKTNVQLDGQGGMGLVNTLDQQRKGLLFAAAGVTLITTNYVSVKYALSGLNAETFSFLWTLSAALYALLILGAVSGWKVLILPSKILWPMGLIGILNGAGSLLTWKGLAFLDPSLASFLWRFHPVITILLGVILLGERFLVIELIPLGLMITGAFITVAPRWETLSIGVTITLLACLINSFQMFMVKRFMGSTQPELIVFYRNAIGAFLLGAWGLLAGALKFQEAGTAPLFIALVGSLLGETISFTFIFKSFSYWGLSRTSLIRTAEPILVILWAYLWFQSFPSSRELVGGSMILIGVIIFSLIHFFPRLSLSKLLSPSPPKKTTPRKIE